MGDREFEEHVADLCRRDGCTGMERVGGGGDLGADVIGRLPDGRKLIEGEHPHSLAIRLGIDRDVYFIGWRGHDELPDGLSLADLMVGPAVNESFGMVYIEVMAAGVPPVATATGGPAALITSAGDHAAGWLVRPDDPAHLAETLRTALADPGERDRRARNGIALVRGRYTWPVVADRYTDLYRDVAY